MDNYHEAAKLFFTESKEGREHDATMRFGEETSVFVWLVLVMLVCLLFIGTCIWLLAGWLKKQRTPMSQDTPQPRDAYEGYEQGYQPQSSHLKPIKKVGGRVSKLLISVI